MNCKMIGKRVVASIVTYVIIVSTVFGNAFTANGKVREAAGVKTEAINTKDRVSMNSNTKANLNNNTKYDTKKQTYEKALSINNVQASTGSAITTRANGLFITEIYSDSSVKDNNSNWIDSIEYIELYNSTNEDIMFHDNYTMKCVTGSAITTNKLCVEGLSGNQVIIPKNSAVVLWVDRQDINNHLVSLTEDNFRNKHKIAPTILVYKLKGLNGIIGSNINLELFNKEGISVSNYHYKLSHIEYNTSVHLKVSYLSSTMVAYKQKAIPSAGIVEEEQLYYSGISADTTPPILKGEVSTTKIQLGDTLRLKLLSNERLQSGDILYNQVMNGIEGQTITVPMTYVGESNGEYSYEGNITPDQLGEYRIRFIAKDDSGNQALLPADKTSYSLTVAIKDTGNTPILTCLDEAITSIMEGEELNIPYSYEDDLGVQKINLYYKTSASKEYKCIETTSFRIAGRYFAMIPSNELLSQDYVEYYLEGFNLYRSTKTSVKRIKINKIDDFEGIRTNLTDNQSLAGNVLITAKDKEDKKSVNIEIDGTKMKQVNLLEKGAFFTFSFTGNDSYYKNAVSVGDNILTYIAKWSNVMQSKAVFVDKSLFTYTEDGSCVVTISLWAGTQGSAFEIGNDKNNDDYKATGFHLVLTDGTILDPDNGIDPNVVQKMGDSKGMIERLDIHYTVPADKVDALGYVWDTTLEKDGLHSVIVKSATDTRKIKVRVDNTAPKITTTIIKNEQLNNYCKANIELSDDTGVNENTLEVYLNGIILKAPYTFLGSNLVEGNNNLVVKATDYNGNQGIQNVSFTYYNGKLVVSSMTETDGKKDSIRLKAMLGDSNRDNLKVSFYEGKRLEIGDEISVLEGTGDKTGSSLPGTLGTVTSKNGEYPYQIYEIKANGNPTDILQVKVGAMVSYNRPVQLYVYNVVKNIWEILKINEEEGIKKAEFLLENHIQNGVAKVLVQARGTETIPSIGQKDSSTTKNNYVWDGTGIPAQYDFSFAWITDTQYYTETWPDIFTTMNQWIVSEMKNQKIKYAIHTGDLVDEFEQTYQWECVDKNMKYFEDAGLYYGVLAGNHDVAAGNEIYDNYLKYFSEKRFKDSPVYGEAYRNNLGHYDLLTIDGQEFIVVYMGWDVYKNEVAWMNQVLQKYSNRKAIICLHRYVNQLGVLDYTGELVQKEVVAKNSNVFAVLNGHYHGAAINITAYDDNYDGIKERTVYQICTDYQSGNKGGSGYVKMLYFNLANNKIYMNSYSKELNDYNYYDASKLNSYAPGVIAENQDIYELDVAFNKEERTLITTSMEATLFTDNIIGTSTSSNGVAEIVWKGLKKDNKYGWYTAMNNSEGLLIRGDINEFIFLPTIEPEPTKPNPTPNQPSPTSNPTAVDPSLPSKEKLKPDYTIPTGLTAVYGDKLRDVVLPAGFTFEDPNSESVGEVGNHTFKVTYTPTDKTKYLIVTGLEVTINVRKADQKINLPSNETYIKTYGEEAFSVKAKSFTTGKIIYISDNLSVVEVDSKGLVTLTGCGKAIITLTAKATKNYNGAKKTISITVKPRKSTITNVKWIGLKTLNLMWEKDTKVSGYEITIAKNNKFTKGKKKILVKSNKITSKNLTNLTNGTIYYVKIRAYKIVDGKKIYGAYSVVKKIA